MREIKIVSPSEGQQVLGDKVTVSFIAGDFAFGADGFINLWLDNPIEEASTAAKITSQFDYILSDLPAGSHKLTLEAVTRNNLPFSPPVKQTVTFTTIPSFIPTFTPSPTPFSVLSFMNSNWQYFLITTALAMTIIGIVLNSTFGKPKIWK